MGPFLLRMCRNGNKTTSGLKCHSRFKFYEPDFLYGGEFWKSGNNFRYFYHRTAAHVQKRPKFHFRLNCWPKFKTFICCFLFDYEFGWRLLQDLCVFWAKTAFVMQNVRNLGASGVGVAIFCHETPKRHIRGWFHTFWANMRANPLTRFFSKRLDEKMDTTKSHREVIFHLFSGNSALNQI